MNLGRENPIHELKEQYDKQKREIPELYKLYKELVPDIPGYGRWIDFDAWVERYYGHEELTQGVGDNGTHSSETSVNDSV